MLWMLWMCPKNMKTIQFKLLFSALLGVHCPGIGELAGSFTVSATIAVASVSRRGAS